MRRRYWFYAAILSAIGCLMLSLIVFFVLTNPVVASVINQASSIAPTQENLWAPVTIAKPTYAQVDNSVWTPTAGASNLTAIPPTPFSVPTDTPIIVATETPGVLTLEIVDEALALEDTTQAQQFTIDDDVRWIDVNLSEQRVYVYEGNVLVNSFIVSTGVADTPTVTGRYKIYVKKPLQNMSGPGYYPPNVPWVMYFYEGYGFHGTYWHNNFGTPMSRGCVNMRIEDAAWLYQWASVGTLVNVHY